ncbi:glycosyltransferase [Crateriforma conspicua]|uniref:glycosyltransferase n=1 Tax=Crateriforma conspicua TaxID=2527996 RepID=UPI00118CF0F6|nr:glycosyltransferase [Crateriforma conspicua]QDV63121.1 GDP-mannose-dependent alpha-(1-6)-phosphatidylinositol monomannoside mannosyltransferase [Crateriforma conspicua]
MNEFDVVHVTQPTTEGVANVVLSIANRQANSGKQVGVVSPANHDFWGRLSPKVATIQWDASRDLGLNLLAEYRSYRRVTAKLKAKTAHLHSSKAGLIGRIAPAFADNVVFQPHGWSFEATRQPLTSLVRGWERYATSRRSHRIVCVSSGEKLADNRIALSQNVDVVPNSIDIRRWDQQQDFSRAVACERLGLESDHLHVVTIGRVAEQKGPDLLLKVWPEIADLFPNARAHWLGDGPMLDRCRGLASEQSGIAFHGPTKDAACWLRTADVVVMPSRWEGHSLALLEAMASSVPVIAFDVAGFRETLDGGAGIVVPAGDVDAMKKALASMLASTPSKRESMGKFGREVIECRYCLEHQVRLLERVYSLEQIDSVSPMKIGYAMTDSTTSAN